MFPAEEFLAGGQCCPVGVLLAEKKYRGEQIFFHVYCMNATKVIIYGSQQLQL